jgi:hypothetical protein
MKKRPTLLFPPLYVFISLRLYILTFKQYLQGIDFLYNVQHDCPLAKCTASGKQPLMQERVQSGLFKTYIEHQPIEQFVINTHAFHNAHLLQATLPRSIIVPIPLYQDREANHIEIAGNLRSAQESKRIATKARAVQKKQEAITISTVLLDKTGSGPNKRARLEMQEADLNGVVNSILS